MDIVQATLVTDRPVEEDASKLRGFFGKSFPDNPLFHHHVEEGLLYAYPKVQYKVIDGKPMVLGIDDAAAEVGRAISTINHLSLGPSMYQVIEVGLNWSETDIGLSAITQYRFMTPWLALNPKNYAAYRQSVWMERKMLLRDILVGNILSMCKGLDIIVAQELFARTLVEEGEAWFKGVKLTCFSGKFQVNFEIPSFLGLGKGTSQGFGTILNQGLVLRTSPRTSIVSESRDSTSHL